LQCSAGDNEMTEQDTDLRDIPWWGTASAAAAPLVLVGGLMTAAELQPPGFAVFSGTVSSLAGQGAADSWVMTLTFAIVGALDVVTAVALRAAALAGRLVLAGAGISGMLVAAFPEHLGGSLIHAWWAGLGFGGLILWPVFAVHPRGRGSRGLGPRGRGLGGPGQGADVPWALRAAACWTATVTLALLTIWFAVEQATRGSEMGLAERLAGVAQTFWPLVVVRSCKRLPDAAGELAEECADGHRALPGFWTSPRG
jgi:hypothetical protein